MSEVLNASKSNFISLTEFKQRTNNGRDFDVVKNPNNGKMFVVTEGGHFKIQKDLDKSKEIKFMWQGDINDEVAFSEGCVINVTSNVVMTL